MSPAGRAEPEHAEPEFGYPESAESAPADAKTVGAETAGPGAATASTAEERLQKALSLAFAYLNRRERTVGEVWAQLERKGIGAETAEQALEVLQRDRYVDDARYALMYVHDKRALDGWGSERIRRELASRGIARELVEQALAEHDAERGGEETELDRALALLRRRFPAPPEERRDRDRALGMLIRRGFDGDLALDALSAHARSA